MNRYKTDMSVQCAVCYDEKQYSLWGNKHGCFMFLREEHGKVVYEDFFFNLEDVLEECKYNNPLRRLVEVLLGGEHKPVVWQ